MQRFGMTIGIKPEMIEEYKKLHADVWPGVLEQLELHHVKNYSIFLHDNLLFGYMEYHGNDYEADMAAIGAAEITQQWWKVTEPCQQPLPGRKEGEWWTPMDPVFYMA
jgi:L-rhamnose mutarotase